MNKKGKEQMVKIIEKNGGDGRLWDLWDDAEDFQKLLAAEEMITLLVDMYSDDFIRDHIKTLLEKERSNV